MRTRISLLLLAGAATLGGCMAKEEPASTGSATAAPGGTVTVADAQGATVATATLHQTTGGVRLVVEATAVPPGTHGIHIHTVGQCAAPGFTTAGGHWNPTGRTHGMESPGGMHQGDLPNIVIAADGTGRLDTVIKGATLTGSPDALLDADGAALVIHADPDDYRTDPAGNSGARIACGVIQAG